jgi:hypothetical protein
VYSSMHLDTSQQLVLFGLFQCGFFTSRQRLPDTTTQPPSAAAAAAATARPASTQKRSFGLVGNNPSSFPFLHGLVEHRDLRL